MKYVIITSIALILMSGQLYSQKIKEFELHGNIAGLKDKSMIYLISKNNGIISKAISNGENFILKGHVEGETNYYFIKLDTSINKVGKRLHSNALWLVNGKMTVNGKLKDWNNLILIGSEPHNHWLEYKYLQEGNKNDTEWKNMKIEFIKNHLSSLFTPYLLEKLGTIDQEAVYLLLSEDSRNSFYGKKLAGLIKQNKISSTARLSGKIPYFYVTTPDGKKVSIYDIVAQSKYTLLDFWASWCSPCRAEIPKLKKIYGTFHNKGFNILGVSSDKKEEVWRKALTEDKTPWIHGIDNIENVTRDIFAIRGIPSYILVDHEGYIVQSEIITSSDVEQIKKFSEKSLRENLHEIIENLLKEDKD